MPPKDRVPFGQKLAYGAGNCVEQLTVWVPMSVFTPVFNIGLGMNPALLGLVMAVWRAFDAIIDPVMGNISDNTRTRWGRRRPYIVIGSILTGLIFPLMWWAPRGASGDFLFWWLLVGGILLYTAFTIWAMPYYSLQLEMTPDYNERTNVSAYRMFFTTIIGLVAGWVLALASSSHFADAAGNPDLVNGMRWISIGIGAAIIGVGILPGLFTKERYYAMEAAQQEKQNLFKSLKLTLSTRPFLTLIVVAITQIFGMGIVGTLGFYLNAYYICGGDVALAAKVGGVIQTAMILPGLLAIPFCSWFSAKYGKRKMLYLVTAFSIVGYLSCYLFFRPGHPWLQIVPALLKGVISVGLWMVLPSMLADIADFDEVRSHARREGSFSSVFSWSTKMAWTVNTALSGAILVWTGFHVEAGGEQPARVLHAMLHCYILLPVAALGICLFAISRYPLSKDKVAAIRKLLEDRRGSITNKNPKPTT